MANYIYSDEDNAPMNEEAWQAEIHKTADGRFHVSKEAKEAWDRVVGREIKESLPFTDPTKADKNCHERCRYSKECWKLFNCKGSNRADFPDECALYYKLDDLAMEAMDIAKEQSKALDDEVPFTDDYDGPEETGEF